VSPAGHAATPDPADQPSLRRHLHAWLGTWPPELPLDVVGSEARLQPGWDGEVQRLVGVLDPDPPGLDEPGLVLSVPPAAVEPIEMLGGLDPSVLRSPPWVAAVAQALGVPGQVLGYGVFRWLDRLDDVDDLDDAGTWIAREDPSLPSWLRPFDAPEVLVARDAAGTHLAGVGIKAHTPHGVELAVVTEPAARGRGLGRRLVATAARRVLAEGRVVTYLHGPEDAASTRVAEAAGFRDRGWRVVGLFPPGEG
jgi:GNAT superfamily N-acetyltransferase